MESGSMNHRLISLVNTGTGATNSSNAICEFSIDNFADLDPLIIDSNERIGPSWILGGRVDSDGGLRIIDIVAQPTEWQ